MKTLILTTLTLALLAGCSGRASNNTSNAAPSTPAEKVVYKGGGLKELKSLTGKRIREIELWDASDINDRFGKLVGADFPKMKEDWLVESPILAEGDTLMAAGCQMNNCDKNQWVMFADVANDNLNIYHIKDGSMKLYKEKGEIKVPDTLAGEFDRMKSVQGVK